MESTAGIRKTGSGIRPPARCGRGQKKPAPKRTPRLGGNGFLNHRFLPLWVYEGNPQRMQKEFFCSLTNLCTFYNLPIPATAGIGFPQNMYQAWEQVNKELREKDSNLQTMIVQDKGKRSVLAVGKTLGMGYDLYYIPIRAYWKMAGSAQHQRQVELLSVIFAYLYQVVKLPFYAESGTYIHGQYDTLYNWVFDDDLDEGNPEEVEYHQLQEDTLYKLFQAGGHILPRIASPALLQNMERVVTAFRNSSSAELELELLGIEFLILYRDYPELSLAKCTHPEMFHPDEEERISADMYTGFYWSAKDCFADEIDSMITNDFNERSVIDEPASIQTFDKIPKQQETELDFARRLFNLIERLREVLIKSDHEEYHGKVQS
jgi:hypothetical protein